MKQKPVKDIEIKKEMTTDELVKELGFGNPFPRLMKVSKKCGKINATPLRTTFGEKIEFPE